MESMQRGTAWEMRAFSDKARHLAVMTERRCWPSAAWCCKAIISLYLGGNLGVGEYEWKALFIDMVTHIISYSWGGCSYKVDALETRAPREGHQSPIALT